MHRGTVLFACNNPMNNKQGPLPLINYHVCDRDGLLSQTQAESRSAPSKTVSHLGSLPSIWQRTNTLSCCRHITVTSSLSQTSRSCGLGSAFSPWRGDCGGNPPVPLPPRSRCARGARGASVWTCDTPPRTSANERWLWITHMFTWNKQIFHAGEFQLTTLSYLMIYQQVVLFIAESDCLASAGNTPLDKWECWWNKD